MASPTNHSRILFLGTPDEEAYLPYLKPYAGDSAVYVSLATISTWVELRVYCEKRNITGIISTSAALLEKLIGHTESKPVLDNYAGSLFTKDSIEIVFIHPLKHLITVSYGPFLAARYISKLTKATSWPAATQFKWRLLDETTVSAAFDSLQSALFIACDIETAKENLAITCMGFTGIFSDSATGGFRSESYVIPCTSPFFLTWIRKFCWELQPPKCFQNGKYDISYLLRFNAPVYNWLWDTANMFHAWYSELPKDLASLGSFFVRESMYWKDLAESSDQMERYRYNALDVWNTANVTIAWFLEAPDWAKNNYLMKFPVNFPSVLAEGTGIKRDTVRQEEVRNELKQEIETKKLSLEAVTATPGINSNSPKQIAELLTILGCKDIKSTEEKDLKKAALRHPLNSRIVNLILDIRGVRKLVSTYLRTDEDITKTSKKGAKELNGRILYSINPHGTDTGRNASKEHHFWCGLQIQNIPRGESVKQTLIADSGFRLAECDLEQAESRDTAFITGEPALINAVSGTQDFHSVNASAFFGVPYSEIYSDELRKVIDKKLRDLAKRVNHGANYNMGAGVLIDTMGEDKILEAKRLLKLPKSYSLKDVAEHLLAQFHRTYPRIAGTYYPGVIKDVLTTKKLVGATGWTRYCFGRPDKNKSDLNAYVAHCPQSLNAMVLDKAFLSVFYEVALHPEHSKNFKLLGQIHDSILFQFRAGHEYLCEEVKKRMEIPVTVTGYDGVTRTFTVPAALKAGKDGKGADRWSETE